ncbi:hypothetical protein HanHA300_Chr15g0567171 [Helianthus annuus]|nr:hypothetical protein HanHA300_Chr15g0567171 [Helianthus annuus]KAJ0473281.1 hypothetical protein HanHA89_Chr15g0616511 [Helianthus annuus]
MLKMLLNQNIQERLSGISLNQNTPEILSGIFQFSHTSQNPKSELERDLKVVGTTSPPISLPILSPSTAPTHRLSFETVFPLLPHHPTVNPP